MRPEIARSRFPPTTFRFSNGTSGSGSGSGSGSDQAPAPARVVRTGSTRPHQARIVFEGTTKSRYKLRYGRAVKVSGRLLTPSGQPIQGATMDVIEQPLPARRARAQSRDGPDRRPRWLLLSRARRALACPEHGLQGDPARVRLQSRDRLRRPSTVELQVGAGVRMKVTPRRARNLQTLRFKGALLGRAAADRGQADPHPGPGQARGRVRWQTFLSAQTNGSGGFRGKYQLTRSRTATAYRFRAVAPRAGAITPTERVPARSRRCGSSVEDHRALQRGSHGPRFRREGCLRYDPSSRHRETATARPPCHSASSNRRTPSG